MATATADRSPLPGETPLARQAQRRLDRLASCRHIEPYRAGDEFVVCLHDQFTLVSAGGHWVHSPAEIATMRAIAAEGRWPRG